MRAIRREWAELVARETESGKLLVLAAAALLFGAGVPLYIGFLLLDAPVLLAYSCLSLTAVASTLEDTYREKVTDPGQLAAKVAATGLYGWMVSAALTTLALVVLNVAERQGRLLLPPWQTLITTALAGFTLAAFGASAAGAAVVRHVSPRSARGRLRLGMGAILLLFYLGPDYLPAGWRTAVDAKMTTAGIAAAVVLASAILLAAGARIWRSTSRLLAGEPPETTDPYPPPETPR